MKLKPLADKVLIERLEAETTTKGGIVLPDSAQEKPPPGYFEHVVLLANGVQRRKLIRKVTLRNR